MINYRIGTGYDVHRMVNDEKFILGGVYIPFAKGTVGHSDADVLLHAICDALLGALALGDIGMHFPDTDIQWKNASSLLLLEKVDKKVKEKGFQIGNIDTTLVLQQPKISEYIYQIRENIAKVLDINIGLISVKATTTEGLGYEGRGEGVSAQAVCLLAKD
ncbi:MAG: 2-C-methyl-D-erythritol 2,4-cyclodiphosphate synthase [Bacteroidales bacterium]|jgi:2-C-methyl-D-erythritol 2,4-cyclodiphosphate synthase|nr:2-C-methyl-D-erythritol 2,4-cyclodiphosphate synthase [Bacteroidales bacterium]